MTPFDSFLKWLTASWKLDTWILAKGGVLLFLSLYLIFSLVVVRQTGVMSRTVTGVLEKELSIAAWFLVVLSVATLILAFIIL